MLTVCNDYGTESTMHISHFFVKHLMFFIAVKKRTSHVPHAGGREIVLCSPVIVSADGNWKGKKTVLCAI